MRLKKIALRRREAPSGDKEEGSHWDAERGYDERKGMDILCVQETRWEGAKAREMGNGYKLYYVGEDGKNNGVGILLSPAMKKNVLKVNR